MRVLAQRSRTQCKNGSAAPEMCVRTAVLRQKCVRERQCCARNVCENGSAAPEMCCVCCGVRGLARVRVQRSCNVCNQYARMRPSKVRQKIFPIGEAHAQCILRRHGCRKILVRCSANVLPERKLRKALLRGVLRPAQLSAEKRNERAGAMQRLRDRSSMRLPSMHSMRRDRAKQRLIRKRKKAKRIFRLVLQEMLSTQLEKQNLPLYNKSLWLPLTTGLKKF